MVMGKDKGQFSSVGGWGWGVCKALVFTMWAANCFIYTSEHQNLDSHILVKL